jgi:hypothetical protein
MFASAVRPAHDRWGDTKGSHVSLFCWVAQVTESTKPRALPGRLHQPGQVLGRGLDSLYRRFDDDHLISLAPRLLRLLPDAPRQC